MQMKGGRWKESGMTGEVGMSITLNEKVLDACVILRA